MSSRKQKFAPPIGLQEFDELVEHVERLYRIGSRLSAVVADNTYPDLTFQALMAFNKSLMSVVGFLRLLPPSQFYAKEGEELIDISSACVLARQVIDDILAFFYLSQPNLSQEEKQFRALVWKYHGLCEGMEASKLTVPINPDLDAVKAPADTMLKEVVTYPLFESQFSTAKGRKATRRRHNTKDMSDNLGDRSFIDRKESQRTGWRLIAGMAQGYGTLLLWRRQQRPASDRQVKQRLC